VKLDVFVSLSLDKPDGWDLTVPSLVDVYPSIPIQNAEEAVDVAVQLTDGTIHEPFTSVTEPLLPVIA